MEPATAALVMTGIGAATSMVGQVSSGLSQQRQAQYNKNMADYNAALARQQAQLTEAAGAQEEQARRVEGNRLLSKQEAVFANAGVDTASGSPLTVMADTAGKIEHDALMTRYNYAVKASQADSSAAMWALKGQTQEAQGNMAFDTGLLGAATTAFKTAAEIFKPKVVPIRMGQD